MALLLETLTAGAPPVRIPIGPGKFRINARAGETYRLVESTGQIPPGALVKRFEDTLVIEMPNGQIIEIGNFFAVCTPDSNCGFALDTLGGSPNAMLNGGTAPIADLSDGTSLMYSQDGTIPAPPPPPSSPTDWKMIAAIGGGALLVGAAAGGGGGGGGGGSGGVTADTTPPDSPRITSVLSTKDQTPVISGTAEAGARIRVGIDLNGNGTTTDAADLVYVTTAQSDGTWSVDTGTTAPSSGALPAGGLRAGSYLVTASATDAAGNGSPQTTGTLAVDLTGPAAPTINAVTANDVVNLFERNAGVEISGTAEAGSTVTVNWGNTTAVATRTAITDANGVWRITFASNAVPADGSSTVTALATDTAGNVGPSVTRTVLVDATAPVAPTLASGPAGVTNDRTPVLSGGAEVNSTITLDIDTNQDGTNDLRYTTTASSGGLWSIDLGTATPASGTLPAGGLVDGSTAAIRVSSADAAGNSTATTGTLRIDSTVPSGPTIDAVAGDNLVNAAERAGGVTITGTVAEANRPVTVVWGTSTVAATVTGTSWTAAFATGQIPGNGASTVSATFVNSAGTTSAATTQPVTVDTAAPSLSIADNAAGTATGPVTYTFTFSEAVTGFTSGDITVSGAAATVSGFTALSSTVYTAVLTPPAGTGSFTVGVAAGAAQDGAGNASTAASAAAQPFQPADTTPPSLVISDNVAGTANGPVTYTFQFSEAVTGFTAGDITVSGASVTVGSFTAVDADTYTAVVTPPAGSGSFTVSVAAGAAQDAAGNQSTAASGAAQAFAPADATPPTVSITDSVAGATTNGPITFTFTTSESVTGFAAGDVTVSGGTVTTPFAGSGTSYTMTVTPTANTNAGTVSVSVGAGAFTDTAGNANTAGASQTQDYDTQAPTLTSITDPVGGTATGPVTFTFNFSESVTGFDAGDLVVSGQGTGTLGALSGSGSTYQVTYTPVAGESGTLSLGVGAGGGIVDAAGNAKTGTTTVTQAYNVPAADTTPPTVSITDNVAGATTNDPITFTFTTSETVTGFTAGDVTVAGGTVTTAFAGSGTSYTMTVTPTPNTNNGTVTVSVGAGAFSDAAGNANTVGDSQSQDYDTQAPTQTASASMSTTPGGTPIAAGGSTTDATPSITVTLSSVLGTGETLELLRDGGSVDTLGSGSSLTHNESSALALGAHSYTARITDAAGNVTNLDLAGGGAYSFTIIP